MDCGGMWTSIWPSACAASFKAVILYDTGVYASLINREVAAWIEEQAGKGKQQGGKKHGLEAAQITTVSLAGTSMCCQILGSVVFLNEVTRQHETIKDISASIPHYFDEIPRSNSTWASQWSLWQHQWQRDWSVVKRSLVAHTSHLWHKAAAILYARWRCWGLITLVEIMIIIASVLLCLLVLIN